MRFFIGEGDLLKFDRFGLPVITRLALVVLLGGELPLGCAKLASLSLLDKGLAVWALPSGEPLLKRCEESKLDD